MYSQILLTTSPRDRCSEPITAASSFEGCNGFCRPLDLPSLAVFGDVFFTGVLVGIDFLRGCITSIRMAILTWAPARPGNICAGRAWGAPRPRSCAAPPSEKRSQLLT